MNVVLSDFCKRLGVIGIAAESLHINGNASLVFTNKLQYDLVQLRPMIATITLLMSLCIPKPRVSRLTSGQGVLWAKTL